MDDFLIRALLAGLGVTLVTGPLGSFMVWRRMAFFGDTLAHSALLGVALGIMLGWNLLFGVIGVCVLVALALVAMRRQQYIAGDTLLGILAHGTLALGLVLVAFLETVQFDLLVYLFGDILSVTSNDLIWIYAGAAVVLLTLVAIWRPLLAITVHEDLAFAEGIPVVRTNIVFMLLIALTVAAAMKIVGILLVAALMIIPAAAARQFSRTPEQMAVIATLVGMLSVVGGLASSFGLNTPTGPSVVVVALILFLVTLMWPKFRLAR